MCVCLCFLVCPQVPSGFLQSDLIFKVRISPFFNLNEEVCVPLSGQFEPLLNNNAKKSHCSPTKTREAHTEMTFQRCSVAV